MAGRGVGDAAGDPRGEAPLLTETLAEAPRLIVRGRAGSGKTTYLKYVATALADALLQKKPALLEETLHVQMAPIPIPVYFPLVDFNAWLKDERNKPSELTAQREADALFDFLVYNFKDAGLDEAFFQKRLQEGRCIVFLDGLDEVEAGRRQRVLDLVDCFIRRFDPDDGRPQNRFVIATRPEAVVSVTTPGRFEDVEVLPLTPEMAQDFVRRWYSQFVPPHTDSQRSAEDYASELLAAFQTKPQVAELAESPLLLTLLALIHYRQRLPDNRRDLYRRCIQLLLEDWDKARPGETGRQMYLAHAPAGVPLDWEGRAAYLEPAAYWLLSTGQSEAQADAWTKEIRDRLDLDTSDQQRQELRNFLEWAVARGALLEKRGPDEDVYGFAYHRTFQEYLAARYLSDPSHFHEAVNLVPGRTWGETLRLLGSELKPPRQRDFLAAALARDPITGPLLVGECLVEIQDSSLKTQLQPGAYAELKTMMGNLAVAATDRAAAGRLVSRLGDDRPGVGVRPDGVPDIAWVFIPAGAFRMGSDRETDPEAYGDETPRHPVRLDAFAISRYPITVAQFRPFVESDGYSNAGYWTPDGRRWKADRRAPALWNDPTWALDNHPVVGVTWYEANAYCAWLSQRLGARVRLPSEAEWEKAARGVDGRIYPWGDGFDANRGNVYDTQITRTSAVGIFPLPDGPWPDDNPLDMCGNVWEWTRSLWGKNSSQPDFTYPYVPGDERENELAGADFLRVVRGGAWYYNLRHARCAYRLRCAPDYGYFDVGFRVLVAPPTS
ncbi:MAG: SUMF1/EgtB/PvdO family nonheme iron enzyme [Anaerolineae bacterium]